MTRPLKFPNKEILHSTLPEEALVYRENGEIFLYVHECSKNASLESKYLLTMQWKYHKEPNDSFQGLEGIHRSLHIDKKTSDKEFLTLVSTMIYTLRDLGFQLKSDAAFNRLMAKVVRKVFSRDDAESIPHVIAGLRLDEVSRPKKVQIQ